MRAARQETPARPRALDPSGSEREIQRLKKEMRRIFRSVTGDNLSKARTTASDDELQLPTWPIPPVIVDVARKTYRTLEPDADASDDKDLLQLLLVDPRMESVWLELYRRGRGGSDFLHPPRLEGVDGITGWTEAFSGRARGLRAIGGSKNLAKASRLERHVNDCDRARELMRTRWREMSPQLCQDLAARVFFKTVFHYGRAKCAKRGVATYPQFDFALKHFQLHAEELESGADLLRVMGLKSDALNVERAAGKMREFAILVQLDPDERFLVARQRTDPVVRGYVSVLADCNRRLFGTPLCGTIAKVVNVVFEAKTTGQKVREMIR
jgi:hypothetical protein